MEKKISLSPVQFNSIVKAEQEVQAFDTELQRAKAKQNTILELILDANSVTGAVKVKGIDPQTKELVLEIDETK